jgi:hypothetical protein
MPFHYSFIDYNIDARKFTTKDKKQLITSLVRSSIASTVSYSMI